MALVSYGSSDESDLSENEDKIDKEKVVDGINVKSNTSSAINEKGTNVCDAISDEEDLFTNSVDDISSSVFEDTGGSINPLSNSLFSSLPLQQNQNTSNGHQNPSKNNLHIDEDEDLNTIPEHKVYKGETLELKPRKKDQQSVQNSKHPNKSLKKGPVRILAPSLMNERDLEDNGPPRKIIAASSKKSGLLGLLPKPKGLVPSTSSPNDSVSKEKEQNSKEVSVTKVSSNPFVPRSVSRKPASNSQKENSSKKQVPNKNSNESDDDSDSEPTSFFTLEDEPLPVPSANTNYSDSSSTATNTFVHQTDTYTPQSIVGNSYPQQNEEINYSGEAIAPYPPAGPSLPPSQDLMENTEALERLVGKVRKGRGGQNKASVREMIPDNIIEVNQGDLTADPTEWMTKALTEDDNTPGPRCNIGGQTKRKHQLTYLAAMAKQNENELKKQWAENSQSRRAHQSKYGF